MDLKEINKSDPLKRNVEHGLDDMKGCTPFDPPSVYEKEIQGIPIEEMSNFLQALINEHREATEKIESFEKALVSFRENVYRLTPEVNEVLGEFYKYFDEHLLVHNEKEEKVLFNLLHQRLIESGEHSVGENPNTAIDVMEDDHVRFIQLGTLSFNLFGLSTRLRDEESRQFVCETAYNTARELIELLRLHIYREDYTLFPLAHQLISQEEFLNMEKAAKKYRVSTHAGCSSC